MTFRDRVQAHSHQLTPTERRLVGLLLEEPAAAALSTAQRLAARAGVNASSVTRLATKLGYAGYPGLRAALGAEAMGPAGSAARLAGTLAVAEAGGVLAHVVGQETAALAALPSYLDEAALAAAARQLAAARAVAILAEGSAASVAVFLARKLGRMGIAALLPAPDPRGLAEALVPLAAGDAVIGIVLRRQPVWYRPALAAACDAGLPSVVIADHIGPLLAPAPGHLLAAPRGPRGQRQSVVVPLAIATALALAVAARAPDLTAAAERYDRLLDRLERREADTCARS